MKLISSLLIILFATVVQGSAAPRVVHLRLAVRIDRDSVVLRWAPMTAAGWRIAGHLGYIVERTIVDENGKPTTGEYNRRNKDVITPWSELDCHFSINGLVNYTGIAARVLYPNDSNLFAPNYTPVANVPKTGDTLVDRFNLAMFCADNEAVAATALGLRYSDKRVARGERFLYRVFVAGSDPTVAFDTAYAIVNVEKYVAAKPPLLATTDALDRVIAVRWKNSREASFSSFMISRSSDNGASYKPLTQTPLVGLIGDSAKPIINFEYVDTVPGNYFSYKYRIVGTNAFADRSEAAACEGRGRDLTPPQVPLDVTAKSFGPRRVLIGWRTDSIKERDLEGYFIERGFTPFVGVRLNVDLLDTYKREYLDSAALEGDVYYRVGAIDTAGNVVRAPAVLLADPDAPHSTASNPYFPKPLHSMNAVYDSTGQRVILTWTPPRTTEKILYRVLRRFIGGTPMPYRTVEAKLGRCEDLYLNGAGHYEYELRVLPENQNVDVCDVVVK